MSDKMDALIGSADLGRKRLLEAHARKAVAEEALRRIALRHALTVEVVRTAPRGIRKRHHVVMARSHAADVLAQAGFNWAQIGKVLCAAPTTARRLALRWRDHVQGRADLVSEDQARAVRDLITAGMSEVEACDQVGVGVIKFQSREQAMRMEGKL